jgi:ATP diphosphatase
MGDDFTMSSSIDRLLDIMARLRDPDNGCPWDLEQSFATIAPHTLEEAFEVVEAIEAGDLVALKDELGDLLFQIVFYAQMAGEQNAFDFAAVADAICDKMIRRHPHVFGDVEIKDAAAQTRAWEEHKAAERKARAMLQAGAGTGAGAGAGVLDGVSVALPALTRAVKLQKRAARVGFDWPHADQVLDKLAEEIGELRAEMGDKPDLARVQDEMGDILFVVANLARKLEIDPESALRQGNRKFERRFRHIEQALNREGKSPAESSLDEMERLWVEAKKLEKEAADV